MEANASSNSTEERRKAPLFLLEKKLYDLLSDVIVPENLIRIIQAFSQLQHQSDSMWELLTKAVINIAQDLSCHQLSHLIMAYGRIRRGSNQLWDYFIKSAMDRFDGFTLEEKINLLHALDLNEIKAKELNQRLIGSIFDEGVIENADFSHNPFIWYNLLLTMIQKKEMESHFIQRVESHVNKIWESLHEYCQVTIMELYMKNGKDAQILQERFEMLEQN